MILNITLHQRALSCTHSGTRWAMRTLISFQTMGTLQWRIKTSHQTNNASIHISVLCPRLSVIKQSQREAKKTPAESRRHRWAELLTENDS